MKKDIPAKCKLVSHASQTQVVDLTPLYKSNFAMIKYDDLSKNVKEQDTKFAFYETILKKFIRIRTHYLLTQPSRPW